MEEKREPLSEMAIERKIQILRNKHMDSEVIALVKSDYEYGLTDDEIGLYLNKSYDIEQMKVLSKCLHKGVSEELLTLLKDSRMAAPKMQTALDYYEKGVPIDAIREVVQKDDTAVNISCRAKRKSLYQCLLIKQSRWTSRASQSTRMSAIRLQRISGKNSIMRLSRNMRKQRIRAMKKLGRVLRNIMAIPIKRRTKRQHPFDN